MKLDELFVIVDFKTVIQSDEVFESKLKAADFMEKNNLRGVVVSLKELYLKCN